MTDDELALATRAGKLAAILERSEVTDQSGASLGVEPALRRLVSELVALRDRQGSLYLVGNGGSASICGHAAIDFVNVGKVRASTLHEPSLLTCMANDHGYENAFARLLAVMARPGDMLVAVSSSGNSLNIRNAATQMRTSGGSVLTLSGFRADNPLRALGEINIWLDSRDYGMVEIGHQFVLHNLSDRLAERGSR